MDGLGLPGEAELSCPPLRRPEAGGGGLGSRLLCRLEGLVGSGLTPRPRGTDCARVGEDRAEDDVTYCRCCCRSLLSEETSCLLGVFAARAVVDEVAASLFVWMGSN